MFVNALSLTTAKLCQPQGNDGKNARRYPPTYIHIQDIVIQKIILVMAKEYLPLQIINKLEVIALMFIISLFHEKGILHTIFQLIGMGMM